MNLCAKYVWLSAVAPLCRGHLFCLNYCSIPNIKDISGDGCCCKTVAFPKLVCICDSQL
jgi:hypothetical protein